MVNRGRLRKAKEALRREGVIVETTDGKMHVFSQMAALGLFALALDEVGAEQEGVTLEEYLKNRRDPIEDPAVHYKETFRLREALKRATPESLAANEEGCLQFIELGDLLRRSKELADAS